MGFNIGRFLGSIAPAIGGAVAGPLGAVVGAGISAGLRDDEPAAAAVIGRATQPGPISQPALPTVSRQFTGGPTFAPSSIGPTAFGLATLPRVGTAVTTALGLGSLFQPSGNGSPISRILAKARQATGGAVTRNKIIEAAKACGLEIAANTFGLDVREVCLVVVKGRTRRRRGVSAADIRRTKRTINFASKIRKDLKVLAR